MIGQSKLRVHYHHYPEFAIVGGVPAKVIKYRA